MLVTGADAVGGTELSGEHDRALGQLLAVAQPGRRPRVEDGIEDDFDKLRDNWQAAGFDVRNVLLRARDRFVAEIDGTDSQAARAYLAETVNELRAKSSE